MLTTFFFFFPLIFLLVVSFLFLDCTSSNLLILFSGCKNLIPISSNKLSIPSPYLAEILLYIAFNSLASFPFFVRYFIKSIQIILISSQSKDYNKNKYL